MDYAIIQNDALKNLFGYKLLCDLYLEKLTYYENEIKRIKFKDFAIYFLVGTTLVLTICFLGILIPVVVWFNLPYR